MLNLHRTIHILHVDAFVCRALRTLLHTHTHIYFRSVCEFAVRFGRNFRQLTVLCCTRFAFKLRVIYMLFWRVVSTTHQNDFKSWPSIHQHCCGNRETSQITSNLCVLRRTICFILYIYVEDKFLKFVSRNVFIKNNQKNFRFLYLSKNK